MNSTNADPMKAEHLKVPGASLYYEIRGSGPVLLMIPGGPTDATLFAGFAPLLADRYTVVTYDPRGLSRSKLGVVPEDQHIVETFADDAHRLLAAIGGGPSYVFGTSGGALIGLELAAHHPRHVYTLVAHEPPLAALLPDGPAIVAAMQEVYDTYRSVGTGPAMQQFLIVAGIGGGPPPAEPRSQGEPSPEALEALAHMQRNMEFFLAHYLREFTGHLPDIAALKTGPTRVVAAVGEASPGQLAFRGGVALADRLGSDVVVFPGDHGGYRTHPVEFAATLHKVLATDESP